MVVSQGHYLGLSVSRIAYRVRPLFRKRCLHVGALSSGEQASIGGWRLLERPPTWSAVGRNGRGWRKLTLRDVRWYSSEQSSSSGSGGGGGGGRGGGEEEGRGEGDGRGGGGGGEEQRGFLQSFLHNLKSGLARNRDMQESLKGFHQEREKLGRSYWVQAAHESYAQAKAKLSEYGSRSLESVRDGWRQTREVAKDASETELARKGQDLGSSVAKSATETMERVSEQVEELKKTDVGQTVTKGATVVKEDLLDDIIKESAPYQPPDRILTRSEMASEISGGDVESIKPNEDAKGMVVTRQSQWRQRWRRLREDNPVSNAFYGLKMRYDESDNIAVRASRAVTDRLGDAFGGAMTQSDMAETLAEIRKIDPTFDKELFIKRCQFDIIPTVLEAFLRGDLAILEDWCHEAAFNVLAAIVKQKDEPGMSLDCKVLEVRDVDVALAKVLDPGPVLVLTFQAQQLTIKKRSQEDVPEELLENVVYVWALCRDQTIIDPVAAWRVLEFGIQSAGKMLI